MISQKTIILTLINIINHLKKQIITEIYTICHP